MGQPVVAFNLQPVSRKTVVEATSILTRNLLL